MSMVTVVASVRLLMTGPTTNTGLMVTRSMPFSLANFHAAFSASVCSAGMKLFLNMWVEVGSVGHGDI